MRLTSDCWAVLGCVVAALLATAAARMSVGDACRMADHSPGICRLPADCSILREAVKRQVISVNDIPHCGFSGLLEIICCPTDSAVGRPFVESTLIFDKRYGTKNTTEPSLPAPSIVKPAPGGLRRAEIACRNLEEHLEPDLTSQILDGTPVEPGEYPHMAAIGFTGSLNESGPIDFRCGGTLIHKQFVLTAAHCVNIRDGTAKIVRLGVVNLKDKNPVDIPIKESYTHPEFSTLRKVNDIAILELEYPANYSNGIFPTCLYTNAKDPDPSTKLYVTGWGYVNTSTFEASDILLKARLQMVPLDKCKESFQLFGQQLRDSHLCATDPGLTKDACHGDSGGPLNAVLSEDLKQYRVVGIIMSGIGCATIIPGLYTRVASYLDFIEDIVWPADKPERLLY